MGENRMFQGDLEGVTLIDLLGTMSKDDRLIESFPRYAQIKSSTVTGDYKNQSVLPLRYEFLSQGGASRPIGKTCNLIGY